MYHFRCQACGTALKVPEEALGRLVACSSRGCDGKTRLPTAAEVEAMPRVEIAPTAPAEGGGLGGLIEDRKLRRQVDELEAELRARLRSVGIEAFNSLEPGGPQDDHRAEVAVAEGRLQESRARLDSLSGGPAGASIANDLRREIDGRSRDRDEALVRLGRAAVRRRDRASPAAVAEVERMEALLAERRARIGGAAAPLKRMKVATARTLSATAVILALFGAGWGGFSIFEHVAKADRAGAVQGPSSVATAAGPAIALTDPIEAAVCLVVYGERVSQMNGTITERRQGWGTGFAISPDGAVLTNGHVVADAWPRWDASRNEFSEVSKPLDSGSTCKVKPVVWVFFGRGEKHEAKIVDFQLDPTAGTDLCLLRVERTGGSHLPLSLNARPARGVRVRSLGFPDYAAESITGSNAFRELEQLVRTGTLRETRIEALFKPDDFVPTLTTGEVTKVVAPDDAGERPWIFHSAGLSHGNSGGPLISDSGVVLGINTKYTKGGQTGEAGPTSGFLAQTTPQFRAMIEAKAPTARWLP